MLRSFDQVKHGNRNSWLCPGCDQYNGWTEEGDYNRDLDLTANSSKRFVAEQERRKAHSSNGLCLNCNLNQELKISQLARYPREGPEFAEYRDHLEKVYRLCPDCEDVLGGLLAEQDRGLAAKLMEWRLENSRTASRTQQRTGGTKAGLEAWLSLAVLFLLQDFSPLSVPGCLLDLPPSPLTSPLTSFFPHISVSESLGLLTSQLLPPALLLLLALLSALSVLQRRLLASLLYLALLGLTWSDLSPSSQLVLAALGVLFSPRAATAPPGSHSTPARRRSPACLLTPPPARSCEEAETRTQDLLSSSDGDFTPSPLPRAAPIKSTSQISFNHEFSTTAGEERERDCDLSSLSIEDFGSSSPSVRSSSTFQLRSYSPVTANTSLFSPSRPLLRPARLTSTSWVAGGYWTPPSLESLPGPALSRASSQSSGFVSATPSLANYQHLPPLPPTPSHSVFSEPLPGPLKLRRRTAEASIPDLACPGQTAASSGCSWTFTVTVTPTGILLAASLIVNITLVSLWYST